MRDATVADISPAARCGSSSKAATPLLASLITKGSVALLSACAEVTGTAPGMFATQ